MNTAGRDDEVHDRRGERASREARHLDEHEAREQHARRGAEAVREVQQRDRPPGAFGARRSAPALISGNVAPSSTDCGRISSAAMSHFAIVCSEPGPSAGKSES